jgi:hypothetical protein
MSAAWLVNMVTSSVSCVSGFQMMMLNCVLLPPHR